MNIEVGSYEAKTRLPELLRGVQAGNRYTITLRGEAIAALVPAQENKSANANTSVERMRQFMRERKLAGADVDLKALIGAGRS